MSNSNCKVQRLRQLMARHGYDFYLVPSSDAHNNEYVPDYWQRRQWICEFDGSAGEALIGKDAAFVWTDGRYLLQAKEQLDQDIFTLKQQTRGMLELENWLQENAQGRTLAIDPTTISIARAQKIQSIMQSVTGRCVFNVNNLIDQIRVDDNNLLSPTVEPVILHKLKYAGCSTAEKMSSIRNIMLTQNVDVLIVTTLDEIAWALNIRGADILFNPVVISYLILTPKFCTLYIDLQKLTPLAKQYFAKHHIECRNYQEFSKALSACQGRIWLDNKTANYWILQQLSSKTIHCFSPSPINLPKACKNSTEINGAKSAHKKDALAVIQFMSWLEKHHHRGISEIDAQERLLQFRQQQKNFQGPSFDTISGFAENGAIIHYRATNQTNKIIDNKNLYLFDSGGQYLEGTTDITRTLHLGVPTNDQKKYYTLVLKGHLALQRINFPHRTTGQQLDVLARNALWQYHLDYPHGTGHGVGSFLCVHEGPQAISPVSNNQALLPGMILSNEPGIYLENGFGIRIENLCFVKEAVQESENKFGVFYCFEDLTLVPYATNLIDMNYLTENELKQINHYHTRVKDEILPLISDPELGQWLIKQTQEMDYKK